MALAGLFAAVSAHRGGPFPRLPAARWAALFAIACAASWGRNGFDPQSAHFLLRKPLFDYVVYGGAAAGAVAQLRRPERVHAIALVYVGLTSLLCVPVALDVLIFGGVSAVDRVPGLINNHKLFAVSVAPWVPALLLWRSEATGRLRDATNVVLALAIGAIALSISRTAWITALVGVVGFATVGGRRPIARPAAMALGIAALVAAMVALPFVTGTAAMADAFDSRMSLNFRAWQMFASSPWVGAGPGMSVRWILHAAPHERINGVDAHGAVQKVAAELGVFGLVAYLGFVASVVIGAWRASFAPGARPNGYTLGATALVIGLHVNLLLSTEYFSASHWMPLAIGLGLLQIAEPPLRDRVGLAHLAPRLPPDDPDRHDHQRP